MPPLKDVPVPIVSVSETKLWAFVLNVSRSIAPQSKNAVFNSRFDFILVVLISFNRCFLKNEQGMNCNLIVGHKTQSIGKKDGFVWKALVVTYALVVYAIDRQLQCALGIGDVLKRYRGVFKLPFRSLIID